MTERRYPSPAVRVIYWVGFAGLIPILFLLNKGGSNPYNQIVSALLVFSVSVSIGGTLFALLGRRWILKIMDPSEFGRAFRPVFYGALFWCIFVPLLYWFT